MALTAAMRQIYTVLRRLAPDGWDRVAAMMTNWTVDGGGLAGKLRELRFRYVGPTREQLARLQARAPRLVYAHFAPDGHAAMQLAEQLGVPLVTALHGYDVTMSDKAMGATRLGREYLQGRAARLQQKGRALRELLFLCPPARARDGISGGAHDRAFDRGVDIDRFKPPPGRAAAAEKIVLFVGRTWWRRRVAAI